MNWIIKIQCIREKYRTTDYYDVGTIWCLDIVKKHYYKIIWNKWLFNKRIVLFVFKRELNYQLPKG